MIVLTKSFADAVTVAGCPALFRDSNPLADAARTAVKSRQISSMIIAGAYISEGGEPAVVMTPPTVASAVTLIGFDAGCLQNDGTYTVTESFPDIGGFCVDGGKIIIWPFRIER